MRWLVSWLTGWLAGWRAAGVEGRLVGRLVGKLVIQTAIQSVRCLVAWPASRFGYLQDARHAILKGCRSEQLPLLSSCVHV